MSTRTVARWAFPLPIFWAGAKLGQHTVFWSWGTLVSVLLVLIGIALAEYGYREVRTS